MDIISFIPARSGSKSVPDKNIKMLGGKPLIAWTIEKSLKLGLRTIVSSDSEEYLKIAREYGVHKSTISRIKNNIQWKHINIITG